MDQATELFFRVTKLFQCKDVHLRRLTYLLIKELANSSDTVIIVTNCLQQDINRTDMETFRANAMRVLCRIIDGAMLGQIGAFRSPAHFRPETVGVADALAFPASRAPHQADHHRQQPLGGVRGTRLSPLPDEG